MHDSRDCVLLRYVHSGCKKGWLVLSAPCQPLCSKVWFHFGSGKESWFKWPAEDRRWSGQCLLWCGNDVIRVEAGKFLSFEMGAHVLSGSVYSWCFLVNVNVQSGFKNGALMIKE